MSPCVLITGAAGYIGSHFVEGFYESSAEWLQGAQLVFLDDLSSGSSSFILALTELAQQRGFPDPKFFKTDLLDSVALDRVFAQTHPDAVLHFAAKISVAESVEKPDFYFQNNVVGSQNLLNAMKKIGCKRLVFSSTAAVYGKVEDPKQASRPLPETTPLLPLNPYGKTKVMMEKAIQDASLEWGLSAIVFRYFNAAGASASGRLGECHDPETHLIPLLVRAVLSGQALSVYGIHYETRDGSCIRDYVHVSDLASAHLLGLRKLLDGGENQGVQFFNLGTERGSSVLEVIDAAKIITGKEIKTDIKPNRMGDSPILIAESSRARRELGWKPVHSTLHEILSSVFNWEKKHHA